MKNIKYLILILAFVPSIAFGRENPRIYIVTQGTVANACNEPLAKGCYLYGQNSILLDQKLVGWEFNLVFLHEMGHYFTWDKDLSLFENDKEIAANNFVSWIYGTPLSPQVDEFFKEAITK